MNEVTMANIIKNLSDELCATVERLHEAEKRLEAAREDSMSWYLKYQEAQARLNGMVADTKLSTELPDMEDLNE